jgi:hypothetical protein
MLDETEILALVDGAGGDLDAAADGLVAAANRAGGEDNVTVVLVAIEAGDRAPVAPDVTAEDGPAAATAAEPAGAVPAAVAAPLAPQAEVQRWGAGAGGRLPALLLIFSALALAVLVVLWNVVLR